MIFIANTLQMNGGTTFLLRACRELKERGVTPTVLVLFGHGDASEARELGDVARVVLLRDLLVRGFHFFSIRQLGVFLPLNTRRVKAELGGNIRSFHIMGVFGLIVARRLSRMLGGVRITVGVYHQNEFMFRARPAYFPNWVKRVLAELPYQNMVFFNEANRESYAKRFNVEFPRSTVLPIGIKLPELPVGYWEQRKLPNLLISVGNLVGFKTYNRHVIGSLPRLKMTYPDIRYVIYGEGSELSALRKLAEKNEVAEHVHFMGRLSYADFKEVVSQASVFIGSGTSLLEAAAIGVPAVVGIESIQEPMTYGYLSDVQGFNYNEAGLPMPLRPIVDCLFESLDSEASVRISSSCQRKSREFGVERMVDGLMAVDRAAILQKESRPWESLILGFYFLILVFNDLFGLDRRFANRRNQSS